MHTETQTPCTHRVTCTRANTHMFTGFRACAYTYMHAHQPPPHTHLGRSRTLVLAYTKCPAYCLTSKDFFYFLITTATASQVPELFCQSTDWINWKFYEVCGHTKWFSAVKSQYALRQCQHVPPYICFEGVIELCSQLWLVVAVWQRDKWKGSIVIYIMEQWNVEGQWPRQRSRSKMETTAAVSYTHLTLPTRSTV